ncbi:MAG: DUF4349 domain-containing protein [Anaerolineales bacterium]
MKPPVRFTLFAIIVLAAILLTACGAPATMAPSVDESFAPAQDTVPPPAATMALAPAEANALRVSGANGKAAADAGNANDPLANTTTLPDVSQPQNTGHMIIKNADVKLQVEDTDTAIDRSTQIVGDVGGYIISSRVWYQDYNGSNYKYATISMGVPVDQFETAMRRLRGLALRVLDENASGQDVTSEFVDLQSQLGNLEATRDRIRSFLDNAKTVDESLKINEQLTTIEGQIEQVKGRMTYLTGRSSYSTITVNLEPKLPDLTPTPTPTLRPTSTPVVWNPGKTIDEAKGTVTVAYQGIIDFLISLFIIIVPLFLPPALIIWAIWKLVTRKSGKPASGG